MKFFTTDPNGITIVEPSEAQRAEILKSVMDDADQADYPEAFLSGHGGIVLGYRSDRCLLYEESGTVSRYLSACDLETAMRAWTFLVKDDRNGLDSMEWKPIQ